MNDLRPLGTRNKPFWVQVRREGSWWAEVESRLLFNQVKVQNVTSRIARHKRNTRNQNNLLKRFLWRMKSQSKWVLVLNVSDGLIDYDSSGEQNVRMRKNTSQASPCTSWFPPSRYTSELQHADEQQGAVQHMMKTLSSFISLLIRWELSKTFSS